VLDHPHIVPVHELGRTADGGLYYTMRRVDGHTLARHIEEADGPKERLGLVDTLIDVCHAAGFAHDKGVVHRDIKPANIMVGTDGTGVLLDWGVAWLSPETGELFRSFYSGNGPIAPGEDHRKVGTPAYLSPEQAPGGPDHPVSPATDVWSLGLILRELLTGAARRTKGGCITPLPHEQVRNQGELPPLPRRGLPLDLVCIAERATRADPRERYANAGELAAELTRYRAGHLVKARRYSVWSKAGRALVRYRGIATAVALAMVVVMVIGATALVRVDRARSQAVVAEQGARDLLRVLQARRSPPTLAAALLREVTHPESTPGWRTLAHSLAVRGGLWHREVMNLPSGHRFVHNGELVTLLGNGQVSRLPLGEPEPTSASVSPGAPNKRVGVDPTGRWSVVIEGRTLRRFDLSGEHPPVEVHLEADLDWPGDIAPPDIPEAAYALGPPVSWQVAVQRDGRVAAIGYHNRPHVILVDFETRSQQVTLVHTGGVIDVVFSPDGTRLATGSWDGSAAFWAVDGIALSVQARHAHPKHIVERLFFSLDGRQVVAAHQHGPARLWHTDTLAADPEVLTADGSTASLTFAEDGTVLLGNGRGQLTLATPSGTSTHTRQAHAGDVLWTASSAEGVRASGGADGLVRLYHRDDPRLSVALEGHERSVVGGAFVDGGSVVVTWDEGGRVLWWTVPDRVRPRPHPGEDSEAPRSLQLVERFDHNPGDGSTTDVTAAHISSDGAVTGDGRGAAWVWPHGAPPLGPFRHADVAEGRPPPEHDRGLIGMIDARLFRSPSGALQVLTASHDGRAIVWNANDQMASQTPVVLVHGLPLSSADIHPAGHQVVTGAWDGKVRLWDAQTGELLRSSPPGPGSGRYVMDVAFSPDGQRIAAATWDGTVRVWGPDGQELGHLRHRSSQVERLVWDDAGRWVASVAQGPEVRLLDAHTGEAGPRLVANGDRLFCVAVLPDGRVAAAGDKGIVYIWNLDAPKQPRILVGHAGRVGQLVAGASGRILLSGGAGGDVRVWALDGQSDFVLSADGAGAVKSLALSRTADSVVVGHLDGTVRIWPLLRADLVDRLWDSAAWCPPAGQLEELLGLGPIQADLSASACQARTQP